MYEIGRSRSKRKTRRVVNLHQNKFAKGYISTIDNSRRPMDSLSDMTNMEVVQDSVLRPRPPLVQYGDQPELPVIGRANVRYDGARSIYWCMNDSGVGKVYKQSDGGSYTLVGGSYDDESWMQGVQSKAKLYLYNGVDNLSYIDLTDDSVNTYTALTTPGAPTVTMNGATSTGYTYYYRITANNDVGESIASVVGSDTSNKTRDSWIENTDYMVLTWSAVTNAESYTVYVGDSAANCYELYTVTGLTFTDYGTLAPNTFKLAPEGNSTEGAVFTHMYSDTKNSQLFGVTADNYLYYSAPGTGDFSPYNGGGYVGIDVDGDTQLNYVTGFRDGRGNPVITVSARGSAGNGKIYHVAFESLTIGDQIIVYPNVYEANGQSGTYAPRATVKDGDSIYYPTGLDFKTTGTSQNVVNILTTNRIDQVIEPDTARLSLESLHKAVGVAYNSRLFFALPVSSTENNEIWYLDRSRKNLWVLRWQVAAKDLWLYEDNAGTTHFCALVGNKVLEFTRAGAQTHQDDDVAWRSRVAFESMVWDEDGITLGSIRNQYFKFLFPKGLIQVNATGLTRKGVQTSAGSDTFSVTTSKTGWGQFLYGVDTLLTPNKVHQYGEATGTINTYGTSATVLRIKPKGLLNQLSWEVIGDTSGTDYILSAVNTKGFALDDLVIKAQT
jgi:hypothetical protein